jgi:hypothetical protein
VTEPAIGAAYRERLTARAKTLESLERRNARVAGVRIVLGLAGIGLLIWLGLAPFKTLVSLVALFSVIAVGHGRLINSRDRARSAVAFYRRGLARIQFEWPGAGDTGDRFQPVEHLYSADLDLFGRGSLFELIATCRTEGGRVTLSKWMLAPATPDEILARQEAVRELVPDLDLREHLAVAGDEMHAAVPPGPLHAWAVMPQRLPAGAIAIAVRLLPLLLLVLLLWWNAGGPWWPAVVTQALVGVAALVLRPQVRQVIDAVDDASRDLDVFVGVARLIERRTDKSARLRALRNALVAPVDRKTRAIRRAPAVAEQRDLCASRRPPDVGHAVRVLHRTLARSARPASPAMA